MDASAIERQWRRRAARGRRGAALAAAAGAALPVRSLPHTPASPLSSLRLPCPRARARPVAPRSLVLGPALGPAPATVPVPHASGSQPAHGRAAREPSPSAPLAPRAHAHRRPRLAPPHGIRCPQRGTIERWPAVRAVAWDRVSTAGHGRALARATAARSAARRAPRPTACRADRASASCESGPSAPSAGCAAPRWARSQTRQRTQTAARAGAQGSAGAAGAMGLRGQIWKRGGSRAKFGADRPSGGSEKVVVLIVVLLDINGRRQPNVWSCFRDGTRN